MYEFTILRLFGFENVMTHIQEGFLYWYNLIVSIYYYRKLIVYFMPNLLKLIVISFVSMISE